MARLKKNSKGLYTKTFMYNGKRYYVYGRNFDELTEKVTKKKEELEKGYIDQINPTLSDYYEYLTAIRMREQSGATIRGQGVQFKLVSSAVMKSGIKFGDMRIKDITRRDIEQARQHLLDKGKTPEYLNICFQSLNHIFACAVIDETIERNPCRALKQLRREAPPIAENRHRALSEEETILFLKTAEERHSFYTNVFKLMLLTGMRPGEVVALYLTDIDKDYVHVRRTLTRTATGGYAIGDTTKTYSGKRDIPITPDIKKVIRDQRNLNNMFFGLNWSGTLFKSSEGELLRDYTVNREINRICKQAGLERVTAHAFRVTFATRFIEQRPQDYKVLSEILGHKDISITLNIYTRVMTETKISAMNELNIKLS